MAALDTTRLSATFKRLIAKMPLSFTFGSLTLTGTRSELDVEAVYSEFGSESGYKYSINAAKSDFTAGLPKRGSEITVASVVYRVKKTTEDGAGVSLRIDLGDHYA